MFYRPMHQERVIFQNKVVFTFVLKNMYSRILISLSVMVIFGNISNHEIHKIIISQIIYIKMRNFEVIFMYLSFTLQKCSKSLSTTFL